MDVSASSTEAAIGQLNRDKGVGHDDALAELLQAGRGAAAVKVSDVHRRIVREERWPIDWTGGKICDVYKRKGNAYECDSPRGILLADHMAKSLCNIPNWHVQGPYEANMQKDQFGGIAGRSTDFASHVVRLFVDWCRITKMSFFVLFVDLVKAFDRIIREIVLGWPPAVTDPRDYLRSLGMTESQVEWMCGFVSNHGPVVEGGGIDPKGTALLGNQNWLKAQAV